MYKEFSYIAVWFDSSSERLSPALVEADSQGTGTEQSASVTIMIKVIDKRSNTRKSVMKNLLFTIIFLLQTSYFAYCQVNIGFEPGTAFNYSLHQSADSIWQIAIPGKGRFTSAHGGDFALITDTINNVGASETSMMEFSFFNSGCFNMYFSFYHKYFTDSLHSGGMVEVSYNNGSLWTNIVYDTLEMDLYYYNFYGTSDTINGGYPSFTGSSDEWKKSYLFISRHTLCGQNDSVRYRFIFRTDSIALPKEGWMIDDVSIDIMPCIGIKPIKRFEESCFTTSNDGSRTYYITPVQDCQIKICSMSGVTIFSRNGRSNEEITIDTRSWKPGYYILSAIKGNSRCSRKIRVL
ncbi:MAG: hypothetical protein KKA07_07020 [Bacteroidetes bacterium]|nr:hypothetical protein [Bacteroidota bacterium]